MKQIDLGGNWEAVFFPQGDSGKKTSMRATVPGNLEDDLHRNGIIHDPYIRLHGKELRQYEFYDWHLSREFEIDNPSIRRELVFEGLDCFAEIRVNGVVAGKTANAFIRHAIEVSEYVKSGKNRLEVIISSANNAARKYRLSPNTFSAYPFNYESLRCRKPAHAWGWDIAPRFALGGIFRPVYLREIPPVRFTGNYLQNVGEATESRAKLQLTYNFETADQAIFDYRLKVSGRCGNSVFTVEKDVWFTCGTIQIELENPRLWWPRGYGEPHLYEVKYELSKGGILLAEESATVGIRTIRLHRAELVTGKPEADFFFTVNGETVFVKGSNWVPADAMHSRDAERIPRIVAMAEELNCNMLRVWGGGVYEPHLFYDLCDRKGIMVWQDFMMGCANYPQQEDFLAIIREEATAVVRELRQHACIALWAGDNECDEVHYWAGMNLDPNHNRITREVIPQVLRIEDPLRTYLPSSPYVSPAAFRREQEDRVTPSELCPEQHLWGPRNYFKSEYYRATGASFVSEMGYHGCPGVGSIRKFISPEHVWPYKNNPEWDYHASNPFIDGDGYLNYRTELMANQVRELFGAIPDSLEDFVLASQICQAEAKKFFIESVRCRKPRMTGILWWNLMDCWPQFSDAVVDYYFNRKLAYHYIRRIQQPVCVMVGEPEGWERKVIIVNDSLKKVGGSYRLWEAEAGRELAAGRFEISPNGKAVAAALPLVTGERALLLISWELDSGEKGANHYLCGNPAFELEKYRAWLEKIARLDNTFEANNVGQ